MRRDDDLKIRDVEYFPQSQRQHTFIETGGTDIARDAARALREFGGEGVNISVRVKTADGWRQSQAFDSSYRNLGSAIAGAATSLAEEYGGDVDEVEIIVGEWMDD